MRLFFISKFIIYRAMMMFSTLYFEISIFCVKFAKYSLEKYAKISNTTLFRENRLYLFILLCLMFEEQITRRSFPPSSVLVSHS